MLLFCAACACLLNAPILALFFIILHWITD
jgi:hypothetical protein